MWSTIVVDELTKIPLNYSILLEFEGQDQIITSVNGTLSESFITRETNSVKVKNIIGNILELESESIGINTVNNEIVFNAKDVYFIDSITRQHVKNHDGYFMFPPHVQKQDYELFHPVVLGPATFVFEGEEKIYDL